MAAKNRQDLIDEALANLGIIQQSPGAGTGTQDRTALINKALFNLGVLSDGRPATAGEIASVTNALPAIVANLSANGVVTIADTNAIPNQYFLPLAEIIADALQDEYGATGDEANRIATFANAARKNLINLTRTFIVERNLDSILADLAARDIVYLVDVGNIPDEWFMHLAAVVADRCKGKGFELEADVITRVTANGAQAIADLRELTRGRPSYNTARNCYM